MEVLKDLCKNDFKIVKKVKTRLKRPGEQAKKSICPYFAPVQNFLCPHDRRLLAICMQT